MTWRRLALAALLAILGTASAAHETTRSYLVVAREGKSVEASLRVAFRDIEVVAWIDEDLDGRITWGETRRRLDAIGRYVLSGLSLDAGGRCELSPAGADASNRGGADYLEMSFVGECPSADTPLAVESRLFRDIDPGHRTFLQASVGGMVTSTMLSAAEPSVELDGDTGGLAGTFAGYFRAGAGHLMGGADHLVFLLALMLPAVSLAGGARRAATGVLAAATGFTLAHALTLTAVTTELLRPPADVITALIALSIVVTAADNLRPFIPAPRTAVATFFGTIHGFGFAGALGALQLSGSGLAIALAGFNLGIEAAQAGVILLTIPALYMLGGGRVLLWVGSAAAGAAGVCWLWTGTSQLL